MAGSTTNIQTRSILRILIAFLLVTSTLPLHADPADSGTVTGTFYTASIDDFANRKALESHVIVEEGTGNVRPIEFKSGKQNRVRSGQRVRLHNFTKKRRNGKEFLEVNDDAPQNIAPYNGPPAPPFPPQPNSPPFKTFGGGGPSFGPPLPGLPVLHSRPSATVKIFLEFSGVPAMQWGPYSVPITPPFDTDADPTTFSASEAAQITEVFNEMAEKYSPFNIDVTTEDPGTYTASVICRVVIGGSSAWLGVGAGGVAYVNGFGGFPTNGNTVFVFPLNLVNSSRYMTDAAAHECGHNFGLYHQSQYDGSGNLLNAYHPGDGNKGPIMGVPYSNVRGLWWYGTTSSAATFQDDMAILSANNFGYRTDDHGNTSGTATSLTFSNNTVSRAGVLEQNSDSDYFSFVPQAGTVTVHVDVSPYVPMLDSSINIYDASNTLIGSSATSSFGESLTVSVSNAVYYARVLNAGNYGDLGQYTLTITNGPSGANQPPNIVLSAPANGATYTAPTTVNLAATASDVDGVVSQVDFYQGSTLIGTDTTSPYTYAWANVAAGTYIITATATDNLGATATTSPITVTVSADSGSGGGSNTSSNKLKNLFHPGGQASIPCQSTVKIYTRFGAEITSLTCNSNTAVWNGTDSGGNTVSSGVYTADVDGQKKTIVFVK